MALARAQLDTLNLVRNSVYHPVKQTRLFEKKYDFVNRFKNDLKEILSNSDA
jgi:hypothetical protein